MGLDDMKGFYLITDNAPIHTSSEIEEMVKEEMGIINVSIFLLIHQNSAQIAQFWALVKGKVRLHKLQDTETLIARVTEASNEIPIHHLQNIIQYPKNKFDDCKMPI